MSSLSLEAFKHEIGSHSIGDVMGEVIAWSGC